MSVLHLKYRPTSFDEVVGQDDVCESVAAALEEDRSRSFIFTGPSGTGKTTIARIIASEVGATGHDLIEVDAATRTGVDGVRELQEVTRFKSLHGGSKLLILDEAHRLTRNAWDALLKVIEEPPPGVYWCFCSTEPAKIPQTIRTRCLIYDLKEVEEEEIASLLERIVEAEELEVDEDVLYLCAQKSQGSPRRAITMMAQVMDCESREEASLLLRDATESKEVVDLCRLLLEGTTWRAAVKLVRKLKGQNPEGIRMVVINYFGSVVLDAKSEKKATLALAVIEAFREPYPPGNHLYPVLLSLGELLL